MVLLLVVVLESIEGDAGDNEVGDEDRRPHEDEAEPAHLEDLVHACVARHKGVAGDTDDETDDTGVEQLTEEVPRGPVLLRERHVQLPVLLHQSLKLLSRHLSGH